MEDLDGEIRDVGEEAEWPVRPPPGGDPGPSSLDLLVARSTAGLPLDVALLIAERITGAGAAEYEDEDGDQRIDHRTSETLITDAIEEIVDAVVYIRTISSRAMPSGVYPDRRVADYSEAIVEALIECYHGLAAIRRLLDEPLTD